MNNDYVEFVKQGIKYSLENIWNNSLARNSNFFFEKNNRTWLRVRHDYLVKRYCEGAPVEVVKSILNSLAQDGFLLFYTSGNETSGVYYYYSLSAKQKNYTPSQSLRSFDYDEFFKASLRKSYTPVYDERGCEVF